MKTEDGISILVTQEEFNSILALEQRKASLETLLDSYQDRDLNPSPSSAERVSHHLEIAAIDKRIQQLLDQQWLMDQQQEEKENR